MSAFDHGHITVTAGRRLASELAMLRRKAGLKGRGLANKLGVSQTTISRTELAGRLPSPQFTRAWLNAVDADDGARSRVLAMLAASQHEVGSPRLRARTAGGSNRD